MTLAQAKLLQRNLWRKKAVAETELDLRAEQNSIHWDLEIDQPCNKGICHCEVLYRELDRILQDPNQSSETNCVSAR
jgi:hypothetical protein